MNKIVYVIIILIIIILVFNLYIFKFPLKSFYNTHEKTIKQIFLAFVTGSSWLAIILFFIGFSQYKGKLNPNNCLQQLLQSDPIMVYPLIAPLYLGLMSAIAIFIRNRYGITTRKAFFIIGIISALIVSIIITVCKIYPFSKTRLFEQYVRLQIYHFVVYSIIIANIFIYLEN